MSNIITGIFSALKFFVENPIYSILIILGIILMPLEVFDIILYVFVNLIVVLLNVIIFILFTLFNIIVWGVNSVFTALWSFLQSWGMSGSAPEMPLLDFTPIAYVEVDLFSADKNLLLIIIDIFGGIPFL